MLWFQKAGWHDPLKQEVIMYKIKFHQTELDTTERSSLGTKLFLTTITNVLPLVLAFYFHTQFKIDFQN